MLHISDHLLQYSHSQHRPELYARQYPARTDKNEVVIEDGILKIGASSIELIVTATDASGNTGTATASPTFVDDDDDDDDKDDDDDDDDDDE